MNEATDVRIALGRSITEKAGATALHYFHSSQLVVEDKGPGDVVTEADFNIERMVRSAITNAFPDDRFIGEEFGGDASKGGFTWLLDPVDGTVNFARHLNYFCVS